MYIWSECNEGVYIAIECHRDDTQRDTEKLQRYGENMQTALRHDPNSKKHLTLTTTVSTCGGHATLHAHAKPPEIVLNGSRNLCSC